MEFVCDNININEEGKFAFAGQDVETLATKYGTPLYLMDEERIRYNCKTYVDVFKKVFPKGSLPVYAGKACCFKALYPIIESEKMGVDVVSPGEIYTVAQTGFDMSKAYFHGNNKTDEGIAYAIERGVGHIIADNFEDVYAIEEQAAKAGIKQNVILRLTPGIDPHTYVQINTGMVDSKFGVAVETGQADEFVKLALSMEHLNIEGYHCHVGSQVFAEDVYERAVVVMVRYIKHIYDKYGFMASVLNMGGGYGVRYVESDQYLDIAAKIKDVAKVLKKACAENEIPVPKIIMEPGRSIVADAGMTLYTAGSVKRITGYKNYVSVDGGMTDNIRYALYQAPYSCYNASRINEKRDMLCTIVGRCCESGDIIQKNVMVPESTKRGDIIAVCTTGAYNFSMYSTYNRVLRPPVVMLNDGESRVVVRRETFEDLVRLDV